MYNAKLKGNLLLLLWWLLTATACGEKHTGIQQAIQALDPHMPANSRYIIIPNQGCDGCISTAEAYVRKNVAKADQVRYIFTRIQSVKLLQIRLGNEVMSSSKVLLDTANTIVYPDKKQEIYPMIVIMDHHQIKKISYQSPDADGLPELTAEK